MDLRLTTEWRGTLCGSTYYRKEMDGNGITGQLLENRPGRCIYSALEGYAVCLTGDSGKVSTTWKWMGV
jgi:hypothetical protein